MAQEIQNQLVDLSDLGMNDSDLFAHVDHNQLESEKITAPRYSYWRSVFRVFFKKKINIFALAVLAVVLLFTYVYPALVTYDPYANLMDSAAKHLTPTKAFEKFGPSIHWIFGAGAAGQPTFDAVWFGANISLSLALICGLINMTIGVLLGAVWGFSKKMDIFMNEVVNIIGNIPYTLLIAVLVLVFSPSFWTMVLALTITGWLGIAYFFRTQVMIIRDREYSLASRCLGTPINRVISKNILPFLTSVIVTLLATELPSYISSEVFLSFIGVGLSAEIPSLGRMIQQAQSAFMIYPWEFWPPVAIASAITVILYVLGQNLADASDPRTHM